MEGHSLTGSGCYASSECPHFLSKVRSMLIMRQHNEKILQKRSSLGRTHVTHESRSVAQHAQVPRPRRTPNKNTWHDAYMVSYGNIYLPWTMKNCCWHVVKKGKRIFGTASWSGRCNPESPKQESVSCNHANRWWQKSIMAFDNSYMEYSVQGRCRS